jgi:hypothetical protein
MVGAIDLPASMTIRGSTPLGWYQWLTLPQDREGRTSGYDLVQTIVIRATQATPGYARTTDMSQ